MMRRLSLSGYELASGEALVTMLPVTGLTQLCLERCVRLTEGALETIATQLSLRDLSLASCLMVGSECVLHLCVLNKLYLLSLERRGCVTDEVLTPPPLRKDQCRAFSQGNSLST